MQYKWQPIKELPPPDDNYIGSSYALLISDGKFISLINDSAYGKWTILDDQPIDAHFDPVYFAKIILPLP